MSPFNATSTKNSGYVYTIPATTVYDQAIYSDMQLNTSEFQNILPKVRCNTAISEEGFIWRGFGTWI
jgi:hypothetical protein